MATDDTELILRARDGDMSAFEQLVYSHDQMVLTLAAQFVTSADDAKDIYQEVFLRVYRNLPKFQFRSEFATWLHRITMNVCLTHKARQKRGIHISLSDGAGDDPLDRGAVACPADGDPADQRAMDNEIASHVAHALDELSPQQRMVFTLRHYEGRKLKDIAALMQCSEGTVKRYLFNATRRMREELKEIL